MLVAGQIRSERHRRGGDRSGALQHAAEDHDPDAAGQGGDKAPQREQEKPGVNDALAAEPIGEPAERDLENRLRQSVGAEREPDQSVVRTAGKLLGVGTKYRQDDEEAEQPQA